jgi:hypothetical protein
MLTIGKIAAVLGVHPDTIRNYEKRGSFHVQGVLPSMDIEYGSLRISTE